MSLIQVPYTNAMRLGQGFNSFTQQICIDDAVVVNPQRAENVIANDGTTMRIAADIAGKPSAWHRIREVVDDSKAVEAKTQAFLPDMKSLTAKQALQKSSSTPKDLVASSSPGDAEGRSETSTGNLPGRIRSEVPSSDRPEDEGTILEDKDIDSRKLTEHDGAAEKAVQVEEQVNLDAPNALENGLQLESRAPKTPNKDQDVEFTGPPAEALDLGETIKPKDLTLSNSDEAQVEEKAQLARHNAEEERLTDLRSYQRQIETEKRREDELRRREEAEEQRQIRKEKREYEATRRAAMQKDISDAAAKHSESLSLKELEEIKAQNQFVDRFLGMMENEEKYTFDASGPRGTSQTVTYSSRFVDKLSDVTDDMCVSAALSIKMAKVGGSGKGSFVDSNKFKESDLNFYISVKVVNHTLNFKDALEFKGLQSIDIGSEAFNRVYGDSFISGFVEGGEFNAIVSMKVHNKAKLMDIKAEAKVALTAGPVDVQGEANVGIARTNLEMNTETTIQVSWCGGGHIKPMEQPWNIQTIMQAAARFPSLVSDCPQRTHAILTKYETLRSFNKLKPATFSPMQYEVAQIYANVLMDSFMSYKAIYKDIGDKLEGIKNRILEIEPWQDIEHEVVKPAASSISAPASKSNAQARVLGNMEGDRASHEYLLILTAATDTTKFEATQKGLSDARRAVVKQMVSIVNEVDVIEKDPKAATDESREEMFQSPAVFETRLPQTKIPERLRPKTDPLTGKRIMAKTQTDAELETELKAQEDERAKTKTPYTTDSKLTSDEKDSFNAVTNRNPFIGHHIQASDAVPDANTNSGTRFNHLEFVSPEWQVERISIGHKDGAVAVVQVNYDNGLVVRNGLPWNKLTDEGTNIPDNDDRGDSGSRETKLRSGASIEAFSTGERVTSAAIEYGTKIPLAGQTTTGPDFRVLSLCLYTNRGRRLLGQATTNEMKDAGVVIKDGVSYGDVRTLYVDAPFNTGTFKGFFGMAGADVETGGIFRLGIIWGDSTSRNSNSPGQLNTVLAGRAPIFNSDSAKADEVIKAAMNERDRALKEAAAVSQREEANLELAKAAAKQIKLHPILQQTVGRQSVRQSVTFRGDEFRVNPSNEPFLSFDNGIEFCYGMDGELGAFSRQDGNRVPRWSNKVSSINAGECAFYGSGDGNLVAWNNDKSADTWTSKTQNYQGGSLIFSSEAPYLEILSGGIVKNGEGIDKHYWASSYE